MSAPASSRVLPISTADPLNEQQMDAIRDVADAFQSKFLTDDSSIHRILLTRQLFEELSSRNPETAEELRDVVFSCAKTYVDEEVWEGFDHIKDGLFATCTSEYYEAIEGIYQQKIKDIIQNIPLEELIELIRDAITEREDIKLDWISGIHKVLDAIEASVGPQQLPKSLSLVAEAQTNATGNYEAKELVVQKTKPTTKVLKVHKHAQDSDVKQQIVQTPNSTLIVLNVLDAQKSSQIVERKKSVVIPVEPFGNRAEEAIKVAFQVFGTSTSLTEEETKIIAEFYRTIRKDNRPGRRNKGSYDDLTNLSWPELKDTIDTLYSQLSNCLTQDEFDEFKAELVYYDIDETEAFAYLRRIIKEYEMYTMLPNNKSKIKIPAEESKKDVAERFWKNCRSDYINKSKIHRQIQEHQKIKNQTQSQQLSIFVQLRERSFTQLVELAKECTGIVKYIEHHLVEEITTQENKVLTKLRDKLWKASATFIKGEINQCVVNKQEIAESETLQLYFTRLQQEGNDSRVIESLKAKAVSILLQFQNSPDEIKLTTLLQEEKPWSTPITQSINLSINSLLTHHIGYTKNNAYIQKNGEWAIVKCKHEVPNTAEAVIKAKIKSYINLLTPYNTHQIRGKDVKVALDGLRNNLKRNFRSFKIYLNFQQQQDPLFCRIVIPGEIDFQGDQLYHDFIAENITITGGDDKVQISECLDRFLAKYHLTKRENTDKVNLFYNKFGGLLKKQIKDLRKMDHVYLGIKLLPKQ